MLLRAACDAVLCAFFLKRDFRSWHAMVVVFGASNLVSNTLRTPQQFYAHASWAHPERMNPSSFWFSNGYRLGGTFLLTLAFLLLLLYTRRHFQQDEAEPVNEDTVSASASESTGQTRTDPPALRALPSCCRRQSGLRRS